jgi:hypothetical protein
MISSSSTLAFLLYITTAIIASSSSPSSSDHYTLQWGPQVNNAFPFASVETTDGRVLQTSGDPFCSAVEQRFKCTTQTTIQENADDGISNSSYTELTIETECDFAMENQFNFRKASNCECEAHVHRVLPDGSSPPDKYCPCAVCAEGFGDAPVAIDCSAWEYMNLTDTSNITNTDGTNGTDTVQQSAEQVDSLIVSQCSSLDCGLSCNGTCRLDCANSDSSCKFCSNNPENLPNASDTSNRTDDPLSNFDGKPTDASGSSSSSSVHYYITFAVATLGMVIMSTM